MDGYLVALLKGVSVAPWPGHHVHYMCFILHIVAEHMFRKTIKELRSDFWPQQNNYNIWPNSRVFRFPVESVFVWRYVCFNQSHIDLYLLLFCWVSSYIVCGCAEYFCVILWVGCMLFSSRFFVFASCLVNASYYYNICYPEPNRLKDEYL